MDKKPGFLRFLGALRATCFAAFFVLFSIKAFGVVTLCNQQSACDASNPANTCVTTVVLNDNGGSGGQSGVCIHYGDTSSDVGAVDKPIGPEVTCSGGLQCNQTFKGYYDATSGGNKYFNSNGYLVSDYSPWPRKDNNSPVFNLYAQYDTSSCCSGSGGGGNPQHTFCASGEYGTYPDCTSCPSDYPNSAQLCDIHSDPSCNSNSTIAGCYKTCTCSPTPNCPANSDGECSYLSSTVGKLYCTSNTAGTACRTAVIDCCSIDPDSVNCNAGYTKSTSLFSSDVTCDPILTTITLDSAYYATSSTTTGETATTASSPTTLYKKYGDSNFYSSYHANLGMPYNVITSLTTNPEYTGYTFAGFYTGKAGTGTQVIGANGSLLPAATTQIQNAQEQNSTTATTWYAHYTQVSSVSCTAGQYLPANTTTCAACPAGSYCASAGTYTPDASDQGITGTCNGTTSDGRPLYTESTGGASACSECPDATTSLIGVTRSSETTGTSGIPGVKAYYYYGVGYIGGVLVYGNIYGSDRCGVIINNTDSNNSKYDTLCYFRNGRYGGERCQSNQPNSCSDGWGSMIQDNTEWQSDDNFALHSEFDTMDNRVCRQCDEDEYSSIYQGKQLCSYFCPDTGYNSSTEWDQCFASLENYMNSYSWVYKAGTSTNGTSWTATLATHSDEREPNSNEYLPQTIHGTLTGSSMCSETQKRYGYTSSTAPSQTAGQYCWCHADTFTPTGNSGCPLGSSQWVAYGDKGDINTCNDRCAKDCANSIQGNLQFRQAALAETSCDANTYTVTLNTNDGILPSGGTPSVTATYDASMPAIDTIKLPTRDGYIFDGYWDATTGGNQYYTAAGASARTWNKASNTTLYAHWTECGAGYFCANNVKTACSTLGTGYTNTTTTASSNTQCYLPVAGGNVRNGTTGTTLTQCAAGTYKATHNENYGTSYTCDSCGSVYPHSAVGSNELGDCYANFTWVNHTGTSTTLPVYYGDSLDDFEDTANGYNVDSASASNWETVDYYDFDGWYAENTFENEIDLSSYTFSGDATIYGKWTPITYDITYELNGGTNNANNPSTFTVEDLPVTLYNPTKTGYTFDTWQEGINTEYVTQIDTGMLADTVDYGYTHIDLTASWTVNTFNITYAGNGNTSGSVPSNHNCTYGGTCTAGSQGSLLKTNNTFNGWTVTCKKSDNSACTPSVFTVNAGGSLQNVTTEDGATITLTARWTACSCGTDTNATCTASVVNNQCKYTHTCAVGYYNANNNVAIDANTMTCSACTNKPAQHSHYLGSATTNNCPHECDDYGYTEDGTPTGARTNTSACLPTVRPITCNAATAATSGMPQNIAYGATSITTIPTKTGYTFNGATFDCGASNAAQQEICSDHSGESPIWINANGTIDDSDYGHGYWAVDEYMNDTAMVFPEDYSGTFDFVCSWAAKQATITFNGNGGTIPSGGTTSATATYDANMPAIDTTKLPTRDGYTFAGYYDATTGGTQYYNADGTSARTWNKDTTTSTPLYAQWTTANSTVTLNKNISGSDSTVVATVSATYDAAMPTKDTNNHNLTIPTRAGYEFLGYYDQRSGGTQYYNDALESVHTWDKTGAQTLYAHWDPITYNIHYRTVGGELPAGINNPTEFTFSDLPLALPEPTKDGYTFDGWDNNHLLTLTENDVSNMFDCEDPDDCYDVYLEAQWSADCNAITFNTTTNGGSGTQATLYKPSGSTAWYDNSNCSGTAKTTLTVAATKTHADFGGYYTGTGASGGTQIVTKQGALSNSWTVTAPTTLTAQYDCANGYRNPGARIAGTCSLQTFTITYHEDWTDVIQGVSTISGMTNATTSYTIESQPITLPTLSAPGYQFDGWYTRWDDDEGEWHGHTTTIPTGSTGNKEFYGAWTGPLSYSCDSGTYLQASTATCQTCPQNSYCEGFSHDEYDGNDMGIGSCADYDSGYPYSAPGATWYGECYKTGTAQCSSVNPYTGGHGSATYANTSASYKEYSDDSHTVFDNPSACAITSLSCNTGYTSNNTNGILANYIRQSTVNYSESGNTWNATFNDGTIIYGTSRDIYDEEYDEHTYECQITGYRLAGGSLQNVTNQPWVDAWDEGCTVIEYDDYDNYRSELFGPLGANMKCEADVYTITYYKDSGDFPSGTSMNSHPDTYTVETNTFTIPALTRNGYVFDGWCENSGLTQSCEQTKTITKGGTTGNKEYWAKWTPESYNITYMNVDENYHGPATYTYGVGATITAPTNATHFDFVGWCNDSELTDCSNPYTISSTETGDKTLYAKWNFVCRSGKWLHIGDKAKACLIKGDALANKPGLAFEFDNDTYYLELSDDNTLPVNENYPKIKFHIGTYNAHDASVSGE